MVGPIGRRRVDRLFARFFELSTQAKQCVNRELMTLPGSPESPSRRREIIRERIKGKVEGLLKGSLYQNTNINLGKVKVPEGIEPFQRVSIPWETNGY